MASLDDVRDDMAAFARALEEFNASLDDSLTTLRARHDELAGSWTDAASRRYQERFSQFETFLVQYVTQEGPRLEAFVTEKLQVLHRYLEET